MFSGTGRVQETKLRMPRSILLAFVLVTVIGAMSCGAEYPVELPGSYQLDQVHSGAVAITHPATGIVIYASVDGYAVVGSVIVGHVSQAKRDPEREFSRPGYFIIDTRTNDAKQGLDKNSWLESLRSLGVMSEPKLHKPSRFDRNYS
jgi:hypothetical protein